MNDSVSHARRRPIAIALITALFAAFVLPRPQARADTTSTVVTILGAAAVAAGIIISNNVRHKAAAANTPVGRTRDGGTVYADGRVVYPNGDVLHTGSNGRACSFVPGYGPPCPERVVVYYPRDYRGHDHGRHRGWDRDGKKHDRHGHDDERGDDGNGEARND